MVEGIGRDPDGFPFMLVTEGMLVTEDRDRGTVVVAAPDMIDVMVCTVPSELVLVSVDRVEMEVKVEDVRELEVVLVEVDCVVEELDVIVDDETID